MSVGRNTRKISKKYLARIEKAKDKKQITKTIKGECMTGDSTGRKLCVLKKIKLFYTTFTVSDFANEDSNSQKNLQAMLKLSISKIEAPLIASIRKPKLQGIRFYKD